MNREQAIWEINELSAHCTELVRDIASGRFDENNVAYQVDLQHLMDHLARAWHFSRMTDQQIDSLTSDEFDTLSNALPKVGPDQRLVEPGERLV